MKLFLFVWFFSSWSYINQRNRSWNIVESEKALVVSVKYPLSKICLMHLSSWIIRVLFPQAEGQNAKNQQMDPFTRRQCKPTMVSNVRFVKWLITLSKIINRITNTVEINQISPVGVQARDPSVHAAILAHLNQKYGSGSGADPSSPEKNKVVRRTNTKRYKVSTCIFVWSLLCLFPPRQTLKKRMSKSQPLTSLRTYLKSTTLT